MTATTAAAPAAVTPPRGTLGGAFYRAPSLVASVLQDALGIPVYERNRSPVTVPCAILTPARVGGTVRYTLGTVEGGTLPLLVAFVVDVVDVGEAMDLLDRLVGNALDALAEHDFESDGLAVHIRLIEAPLPLELARKTYQSRAVNLTVEY